MMKMKLLYVDWILIIVVVVSILILAFSIWRSRMSKTAFGAISDAKLKDAIRIRNTWLASSIVFQFIHYWCILFSILTTILVLYLSCFEAVDNNIRIRIMIYSALSLFSNMLPYVVKMEKIAKKYRVAYVNLMKGILGDDILSEAIVQGENKIYEGLDE